MTVERFFIEEAKKANDIENFLRDELDVSGFSHADVKKTPLGTRIIIYALRPGLVIGGGGSNIKRLTSFIGSKFGLENPHLEVEQIKEAFLDPHIVAWRIARSLEKGAYFKRVANLTMQRVEQAGAKGVEIRMGGKLPSSRAKTWIFTSGKLRKCGQDAIDQVQTAYAKSMTKPGIVGVKVSILPPEATFSDAIIDRNVEIKAEKKPLKVLKGVKAPKNPEVKEIVEKDTVDAGPEDKVIKKADDENAEKRVENNPEKKEEKPEEAPKAETKAEPVKEEPKPEPVKEEPKAEPVKEEPKAEPVKEEKKPENKEEAKAEEKLENASEGKSKKKAEKTESKPKKAKVESKDALKDEKTENSA